MTIPAVSLGMFSNEMESGLVVVERFQRIRPYHQLELTPGMLTMTAKAGFLFDSDKSMMVTTFLINSCLNLGVTAEAFFSAGSFTELMTFGAIGDAIN